MLKFKDLRISIKLTTLIIIFLIGFIGFGIYAIYIINNVDINSSFYENINRDNEFISDVLPPSLYIIESHYLALKILHESDSGEFDRIEGLIKQVEELELKYQIRHAYWTQSIRESNDPEIAPLFVGDFNKTVKNYYTIFNEEFVPAIRANETETAHQIYDRELTTLYEIHRANVDALVIKQKSELVIEKNSTQSLLDRQRTFLLALAILTVLVSLILAVLITRSITNPIANLTNATNLITAGNLDVKVIADSQDEIGILSNSFNEMTLRQKDIVSNFEARVTERTQLLDKRTNQLKAIADVGTSIATYRNLNELLQQTTRLIHKNFGYYHIAIYLLDERKQYAILTAANSEGGMNMIARGYQLKVGETGIIGYVAKALKARIALDVGKDAIFFNEADLKDTRSEVALPLMVAGEILGVLDIQSTEPSAFVEDDISTLQVLTDQIAVAIQNANLFSEAGKALESSRLAYGELSREAWMKILRNRSQFGYIATSPGIIESRSDTLEPSIAKAIDSGDLIIIDDGLTISVPIKIRGQAIGAFRLKKSDISEAWTLDETNLAVTLSDQLSSALESARLYQDSQQRAARESLVSDISARLSAVTQLDLIIRETVQELGEALGNASVTFQLLDQPNNGHAGRENPSGKAGQ